MSRQIIAKDVERKLYAESMGRCMNPACNKELFRKNGDIIEKAHIVPYCETADNVFENLVVLCPNCHTDYDKNHAFSSEDLKNWKKNRKKQLEKFFSKKCDNFSELKKEVAPILAENKSLYENYFLGEQKKLWEKFEGKILSNNRKLKMLFENNLNLFQKHNKKEYSNLEFVKTFLAHVDEFEVTRSDEEKIRKILFPTEINSMFGIADVEDSLLPMTEAIELLVEKLSSQGKLVTTVLGITRPYIQIKEDEGFCKIYLDDTPRLRQLLYENNCFRGSTVRLNSLNFALNYLRTRKVCYSLLCFNNFREIIVNGTKMTFVYEYCLSVAALKRLLPEENTIIVNLHNWNGTSCISQQAYEYAGKINVVLKTMDDFYEYVKKLKN